MSDDYCQKLKKIELHAHLNGSLSVTTIGRLGKMMVLFYPGLSQCGNCCDLVSHFGKNFVKVKFLLDKSLKS